MSTMRLASHLRGERERKEGLEALLLVTPDVVILLHTDILAHSQEGFILKLSTLSLSYQSHSVLLRY